MSDTTVHVIDDDIPLLEALGRLFRSVDIDARCYSSVQEFLSRQIQDKVGCIVIDVRLPGISGLEFQSQISQLGVQMPIIIMTGYGDVPMSVQAMKAGAIDFLSKPFRDQEMLDAVAVALERDRRRLVEQETNINLRERRNTLSPREQEVFGLVTSGRLNKQIADDLGLKEITVKIHRGSVMRKMGARSLAELVRMADTLQISRS